VVEWLLILQFFSSPGLTTTQVGPFKSEAACVAAGKASMEKLRVGLGTTYKFICVPTDLSD